MLSIPKMSKAVAVVAALCVHVCAGAAVDMSQLAAVNFSDPWEVKKFMGAVVTQLEKVTKDKEALETKTHTLEAELRHLKDYNVALREEFDGEKTDRRGQSAVFQEQLHAFSNIVDMNTDVSKQQHDQRRRTQSGISEPVGDAGVVHIFKRKMSSSHLSGRVDESNGGLRRRLRLKKEFQERRRAQLSNEGTCPDTTELQSKCGSAASASTGSCLVCVMRNFKACTDDDVDIFCSGGGGSPVSQQLLAVCPPGMITDDCIPRCDKSTYGYSLLLNVDGEDAKLTCELHNGLYSWYGGAGDGGYVGHDPAAFFASVLSGSAGLYLLVLAASADIHTAAAIGPYQKVAIRGDRRTVVPADLCLINGICNEVDELGSCAAFTDATDCGWPLGAPTPAVLWSGGFSIAENGHLRLTSLSMHGQALEVLDGGTLVLEGVMLAGGSLTARNMGSGVVSLSGSCTLAGDFKLSVLGGEGAAAVDMVTVEGGAIGEYVSANITDGGSLRLSNVALPLRALVGAEAQLGVVAGTYDPRKSRLRSVLALENVTVRQEWGALNIEVRQLGYSPETHIEEGIEESYLIMVPNIAALPCCGYGHDLRNGPLLDGPSVEYAVHSLGRFHVPTNSACATRDGGRCVGQPDGGSNTEVELCQIEVTGGGGVLATTTVWDVGLLGRLVLADGRRFSGVRSDASRGYFSGPPPAGLALPPGPFGRLTWKNSGSNSGPQALNGGFASTWEICFAS